MQGIFESDGTKVFSTNPLFSINPPKGWSVIHGPGGNSPTLIMQEPEPKFTKGSSEPIFRRNITVSLIQGSAPIDDIRIESFKNDLANKFGRNPLTKNFQIIETRYSNWKRSKDAIIAYSGWMAGDIQMMQMHVLVSGHDQQFMMSYTDMASRFIPESDQMTSAWNSMMSLNLDGVPPSRYGKAVVGAGAGLVILSILFVMRQIRRRRHKNLLEDGEFLDGVTEASLIEESLSHFSFKVKPLKSRDGQLEFDPVSIPDSNPMSELPIKISRVELGKVKANNKAECDDINGLDQETEVSGVWASRRKQSLKKDSNDKKLSGLDDHGSFLDEKSQPASLSMTVPAISLPVKKISGESEKISRYSKNEKIGREEKPLTTKHLSRNGLFMDPISKADSHLGNPGQSHLSDSINPNKKNISQKADDQSVALDSMPMESWPMSAQG